ncbi:unnamed protein product [Prorocentrum cordatum]|uniref:Solute carrier family 40 protein n=1 Tax=Prorocentrum cordatum TaxID=2364126 RepID=A0ABN9RYI4_9DINO|nr:unnamed protein product [Polarella glacialis]
MAAVAAAAAAPPARSWSASTGPVPPSSPASSKKGGLSYLGEVWIMLRWTWPLLLGNTLEWYEFGVYGYVEAEISDNFFGGSQEGGWLGFAVTFVARPVGGFLLGWVADRWSRKLAVNLSLAGMIVATVGQVAACPFPRACFLASTSAGTSRASALWGLSSAGLCRASPLAGRSGPSRAG